MTEGYKLPAINGNFMGKPIVATGQFARADIEMVMTEADGMAEMVKAQGRDDLLEDLIIADLFFEPSTRTYFSFEVAAQRLRAGIASTQSVEYSSISKGESLEDTIRTIERYAGTIIMRHPDDGSAAKAASVARVPVINAGDGPGEHPTQALLDAYTIKHKLGKIDGLTVTMVGDLKHGRTVHSLARLLSHYDIHLNYVSPPELAMPVEVIEELVPAEQFATHDLHQVIGSSDVVYMTRTQKERFSSPEEFERHKNSYLVDPAMMKLAKSDMVLMHPLPRNSEIQPTVDSDPRAAYFDQVESGLYIRMALLAMVNGRSILGLTEARVKQRTMEPWMMTTNRG